MQQIKIKPASETLLVRDPLTREALAQKGESKPRNVYWLRRLQDGSVIEMNDKKKQGEKL
ncbi:DUF2635 domain-containing protein [Shewanella sp. D64]|uniref:DUF2635 domain-containing protein n=1 Tax=unclassified Shewanella TaxID=196818 RepID=UPI0022BA1C4D|nr:MULTISPECIES: DUF2635 domain-containing protein [unclassified Shewanella]MEC4729000.1 DUF2635 domain-containing protein [Shewanella sp. D64]MEC4740026.1 DUF2635 domain-containing protein [Shewanella sp. E94]WBJ94382.1 DUF2635 domain-containing protein [Shewanella sp. MTB7]